MKKGKITSLIVAAIIIAACSTHKKNSTSTVSSTPSSTTTTPSAAPVLITKSPDGIYAPGNDELIAIQVQYTDVTMEQLKEGHKIYAEGACVNCHSAKSIYKRSEANWIVIIEDMSRRAKISDTQKDAVYKYVLAIKATQPK